MISRKTQVQGEPCAQSLLSMPADFSGSTVETSPNKMKYEGAKRIVHDIDPNSAVYAIFYLFGHFYYSHPVFKTVKPDQHLVLRTD